MSAPLISPAAVGVGQTAALFIINGQPVISLGRYDCKEHRWIEVGTREPTSKEWPFPRALTKNEIEEYEI